MVTVCPLRDHLIRRQIALGMRGMEELRKTIESQETHAPGHGQCVALLALWVHQGFDGLDLLCEQLDRIDAQAEWCMPAGDHVYLELARGVFEFMKGEYENAVGRLANVDRGSLAQTDPFIRITVCFYIGRCFRRMGRDEEALQNFRKASALAATEGFPETAAVIHIHQAWLTFHHDRRLKAALDLIRGSRQALADTDDATSQAYLLMTEGRILRRTKDCERSVHAVECAVALFREAGSSHPGLAKGLKDLAFVEHLLAKQLETEADRRSAIRAGRNAALDALVDPLKVLARDDMLDEDLRIQAQHPAVVKFLNMQRAAALAAPRSGEDLKARSKRIADLRKSARLHLTEAEQIFLRLTSSRGLGTVALYRGFITLDEGDLTSAEFEGNEAQRHAGANSDGYLTVRVEIFQCQVALAKFWEDAEPSTLLAALAFGTMAVDGARDLGNDRLLGRALTWLGLASLADHTSGDRETSQACCDEATVLFTGSPSDYALDDLSVLRCRLRGDTAGERALGDIMREALTAAETAMLQGADARTPLTYTEYESRIKQTFANTLVAGVGGPTKINRLFTVMEVSGSKVRNLRKGIPPD
jgi:tetratricopeptide (TPR) repeat protein